MPFITAEQIHNGHGWLPGGYAIEVTEDGTIVSIAETAPAGTTQYKGVITPGFVNAHCHLELSHMRGVIPQHTGLVNFLKHVPIHRNDHTDEQKKEARHKAHDELIANGVVAVGDIANTADSLDLRARDQLHFLTFAEALGFSEINAARSFGGAVSNYNEYARQPMGKKLQRQAIVPHAPYSVSSSLFRLIDEHSADSVLSIHNQESTEENIYFKKKKGGIQDLLHTLGIDDGYFQPSGKTSLQTYLEWLASGRPVMFVHNTYTSQADIHFVRARLREAYWCLCPNANLYIEQRLPDIELFVQENLKLCIGTDSLASNERLSILGELQTIRQHYPALGWDTLLTWATYNGAMALQMQDRIGSIEPGKQPGLLLIDNIDAQEAVISRLY